MTPEMFKLHRLAVEDLTDQYQQDFAERAALAASEGDVQAAARPLYNRFSVMMLGSFLMAVNHIRHAQPPAVN
jgi:hypothetical protein